MISSYRLGDLVLLHLSESEQNDILDDHPNTIGSEYILAKRTNARFPRSMNPNNNIDLIFCRDGNERLNACLAEL